MSKYLVIWFGIMCLMIAGGQGLPLPKRKPVFLMPYHEVELISKRDESCPLTSAVLLFPFEMSVLISLSAIILLNFLNVKGRILTHMLYILHATVIFLMY